MKKHLLSLLVCFLILGICFAPIAAAESYNTYNYPWSNFSRALSGTTNATVSIEVGANQNVFIDRITVWSDKINGAAYINERTREATAFNATHIQVAKMLVNHGTPNNVAATAEVNVFGGGDPMVPLWVGDQGKAISVSAEGTAAVHLIVNGRIGQNSPANPSKISGY